MAQKMAQTPSSAYGFMKKFMNISTKGENTES